MKVSTVLKPTALFAAGSFAAAAQAAPVYDYTRYDATDFGTAIKIGGVSTAQYNFTSVKDFDEPVTDYVLTSNGTARVTPTTSTSPSFPSEGQASATSVKTGYEFGPIQTLAANNLVSLAAADPSVTSDNYVGLRFDIGSTRYSGYAGLINSGGTINQIVYDVASTAAVPEPETWALMIAGFGGIGLRMRRRRRQTAVALAA